MSEKDEKDCLWRLIYALFTGQPVRRVFLCAIVMNLRKNVLRCMKKDFVLILLRNYEV